MNKAKITFAIATAAATAALFATPAFADTTCTTIYGGGQSCVQNGNVIINKKVENPTKSGDFQDNLGSDKPYAADHIVNFQITITNNGGTTLGTVTVKDIIPSQTTFVSGPGNFDANTNTLTYTESNVQPNESRTQTVTVRTKPADQLPAQTMNCEPINQALATANGQTSQDNASFCISKTITTVVPSVPVTTKGGLTIFPSPTVTTTPKTGPEMFALAALVPAGALGQFLRKKTSK